jgi:hypothetical protein
MILRANSGVGLIVGSHRLWARDTRPYQSADIIGFSRYLCRNLVKFLVGARIPRPLDSSRVFLDTSHPFARSIMNCGLVGLPRLDSDWSVGWLNLEFLADCPDLLPQFLDLVLVRSYSSMAAEFQWSPSSPRDFYANSSRRTWGIFTRFNGLPRLQGISTISRSSDPQSLLMVSMVSLVSKGFLPPPPHR